MFVTAAGNEADRNRYDYIEVRNTERTTTSERFIGDPVGDKAGPVNGLIADSSRQQLESFGFRNVDGDYTGGGDKFDHGKDGIKLPDQERDFTVEKTYEGNLTSLVKSLIAPIEDIVRLSKKEFTVASARPYGELQSTAPPRITVKDPNDVARTTIKETTVQDTREGNIKGPRKLTVYDPNDIARTTIRQTMDEMYHPNLKGNDKLSARDPDAKMRHTIRETMPEGDNFGNIVTDVQGGYLNADVHAPNTQKEFLSDNDYYGGAIASDSLNPSLYDVYYNADMNVLREGTLEGRVPTSQGTKESVDADKRGDVSYNKLADSIAQHSANIEKVVNQPHDSSKIFFTKTKDDREGCANRLDDTVLSSLQSNPYAMKPLACLA
jgi:hypothetical protein